MADGDEQAMAVLGAGGAEEFLPVHKQPQIGPHIDLHFFGGCAFERLLDGKGDGLVGAVACIIREGTAEGVLGDLRSPKALLVA
jgi:hypothetical protein